MNLYQKLLTRPEWKAKRAECIEKAQHRCERCGSPRNLQVHHPHYERGKMPWEYDNLQVLCAGCHQSEHNDKKAPPLVGGKTVIENKFFHSIGVEGYIKWQGQVLGHVQDGYYLVQCYSWMGGDPTNCEIVPFSSMVGWMFYCTADEMNHSYQYGPANRLIYRPEATEAEATEAQ